tara:strand:- start:282 stop:1202 length:921 start_codon:yes stop_codon:yes gene_type:complete
MGLFGFDSVADAFDGGGAGKAGDSYSMDGVSFSGKSAPDKASIGDTRPVSRPTITATKNEKGETVYKTSRDESNAATFAQLNPAAASGNFSEYAPGTVNQSNNMIQRMVRNHPLARGMNFLTGTNTSEDKVVNLVDGKPVRQNKDGSLYAMNAMGLAYAVKSIDSLDEDPGAPDEQADYLSDFGAGNEETYTAPEASDPCPEGYVYDQEKLMCVIDSDVGTDLNADFNPAPSVDYSIPDPMDVSRGGSTNYTQQTGNFIPTPLQPVAPNPIQQQLNQLSRSMGAPPQQQRPAGLAGANTGIMQVRP